MMGSPYYLISISKIVILVSIIFSKVSGSRLIPISEPDPNLDGSQLPFQNLIIPPYLNFCENYKDKEVNLFSDIIKSSQASDEDAACLSHLKLFEAELQKICIPGGIFNVSTWALQMIDAWGKIPEGMLAGHLNSYGDWDECVDIQVDKEGLDFRGQYCWIYLVPKLPAGSATSGISGKGISTLQKRSYAVSLLELLEHIKKPAGALVLPSTAICLPSTCSAEIVQTAALELFSKLQGIEIQPTLGYCRTGQKPELSAGSKAMIYILAILVAVTIVASLLDVFGPVSIKKALYGRLLISFSLPTNVKKWQHVGSGAEGFGCMHGMRFLSTCWVVLCHTLVIQTRHGPAWNNIYMNRIYKNDWAIYFILNGFFAVDTFFAMSGLLAAHGILKVLEKTKGRLNVPLLYLHRYLRLTPTYALIVGILATLYQYSGSGPYFSIDAEKLVKDCTAGWWHNLLYINNLWDYDFKAGENLCEGETWYISNDMQFFILSPVFIYLLYRWPKIGVAFLGSVSIASIVGPGIYVAVEKLPPTSVMWKRDVEGRVTDMYIKPWFRISPYLAGLWMGWILHKLGKKDKPLKLHPLLVGLGWTCSTVTIFSLLWGVIPYFDIENDDDHTAAGFYAGPCRFLWGSSICWVIFACVKGYGGWVNQLLCWKAFVPLGRLTFCVYLSSFSVQALLQLTYRQPVVVDMYHLAQTFFAHIIMCFFIGFLLTMTLESPFIALEKIFFSPPSHPRNTNTVKPQQENNSQQELIVDEKDIKNGKE